MGLFSKSKQNAENIAICLGHDGLYCAIVQHDSALKPILRYLSFFPGTEANHTTLLERLMREAPVKGKPVSMLLKQGEYQILAIEALNVPETELRSAVKWRVKDMLDFPVGEATVDVLKIPGDPAAGGRNQSSMVVVAKNQIIKKLQTDVMAAKLKLTVIDIPEMAQRNISAKLETPGRGLAMLSFDANGGLLTLSFGGELYLSRRIDINLEQLRNPDKEAQNYVFERVSLELQRSLDHFERQHNYITNTKLLLAPMGDVTPALQSFLSTNLYLPIETFDLSNVIDLGQIPEMKSSDQQQKFFDIIGAAMRVEARPA
ncbi:agglutinin biogenesis protein MshI [Undibacterium cyanobacteriorum]|uniref:Agglutinin biogenesis protein MshI n=1 Tax=Undibacterium cyanobacteriorum TaxID=3073561 RepID=A0ABY9RFF6_9BURK|nr:agglutinin biogenesis protein MshI [Undibacterium sp. 20NA77.5]WMW79365.1 agglutinin biogenesis protein MshI [Undibacterium sp. 20NA77.5]